jgi:hypothetical protein
MANDYAPKVGDIVTVLDQNATFKVVEVTDTGGVAIRPFHVASRETFGQVMPNIRSGTLKPFKDVPGKSEPS